MRETIHSIQFDCYNVECNSCFPLHTFFCDFLFTKKYLIFCRLDRIDKYLWNSVMECWVESWFLRDFFSYFYYLKSAKETLFEWLFWLILDFYWQIGAVKFVCTIYCWIFDCFLQAFDWLALDCSAESFEFLIIVKSFRILVEFFLRVR